MSRFKNLFQEPILEEKPQEVSKPEENKVEKPIKSIKKK